MEKGQGRSVEGVLCHFGCNQRNPYRTSVILAASLEPACTKEKKNADGKGGQLRDVQCAISSTESVQVSVSRVDIKLF